MDSESVSKLQMQPNFPPSDGNEENHRLNLNLERVINQSGDKQILLSRERSSSRDSLVIKDEGGGTHEAYEDLQRSSSALDNSTTAGSSKAKKKQLRRNIALNNSS